MSEKRGYFWENTTGKKNPTILAGFLRHPVPPMTRLWLFSLSWAPSTPVKISDLLWIPVHIVPLQLAPDSPCVPVVAISLCPWLYYGGVGNYIYQQNQVFAVRFVTGPCRNNPTRQGTFLYVALCTAWQAQCGVSVYGSVWLYEKVLTSSRSALCVRIPCVVIWNRGFSHGCINLD